MKVIEDVQDKYGNYCIIFKSTNLRLIYDWLHTHYSGNGFKFAIVIDLSIDCDYETPTETVVYFLDAITEEVLDYAGFKLANTEETYKPKQRQRDAVCRNWSTGTDDGRPERRSYGLLISRRSSSLEKLFCKVYPKTM